jgi:hypothetical protein
MESFYKFYQEIMDNIANKEKFYQELNEREKEVYDKDIEIGKSIIIHNKNFKKRFKQIFKKYFPDIQKKEDDVIYLVRNLIKIDSNSIIHFYYKYIEPKIPINNDINFRLIIIGCPESTDYDVIIIVDETIDVESTIDNDNIRKMMSIISKKPIKIDKKIDANIIHLKNKRVIKSQKGSIKTIQGIIYYTQELHNKPEYLIEIDRPDTFKIEDRIIPPITFILYNLNIFCGKSVGDSIRDEKIKAINSNEKTKIDFLIDNKIFDKIFEIMDEQITNIRYKDYIKALFVKLSTIILINKKLSENTEYYTKRGIANLLDKIYPQTKDFSLYFLFRGKEGVYNKNFIKIIFDEFIKFAQEYKDYYDFEWHTLDVDFTKKLELIPSDVIDKFWSNPYDDIIVNDDIIIKSTNKSDYDFESIPEFTKNIKFIDQRSKEWFNFRKIYPPNKKNIIDDEKINHNYISGSIGEQYLMFNVDWNKIFPDYHFVSVGMLIHPDKGYSISPDGFLINFDIKDIIPIEIKTIKSNKNLFSQTMMREIKIAVTQLKTVNEIINCKKGLITFMFIQQDKQIITEYAIVEL